MSTGTSAAAAAPAQPTLADALEAKTPPAAADPKPIEAAKPDPEKERMSRHFAALSKRDRQLSDRERSLKDRESKYTDFEQKDKIYRDDPLALLQAYGHNLDAVVKRAANGGKMTPEDQAKKALDEIEKFRKERDDDKRTQEEAKTKKELDDAKAQESSAVQSFKDGARDFIEANKEKFPITARYPEHVELIYNIVDQVHAESGQIMEFDEACDYAEKALEKEAEALLEVPKLRDKITPPDPKASPAPGAVAPPAEKPKTDPVTLSNELSAKSPGQVDVQSKNKSFKEELEASKKRAAALLRWSNT